jgi:hypothetical protein
MTMSGMHGMDQVGGGASEHTAALAALLYLPVVIVALLLVIQLGSRAGVPMAQRFLRGYVDLRPPDRLALLGMLISATIHLALVPSHASEDRVLAVLFALDGLALLALVGWALTLSLAGWRSLSLALPAAGVVTYLVYVLAGLEQPDAVGMMTKLVELATLALLVRSWSPRSSTQPLRSEKVALAARILQDKGGLDP